MLKPADIRLPQLRQPLVRDELSFNWEPLRNVLQEALPIIRRHYEGLGLEEPFDPDWAAMLWMASQGRFAVLVARNDRGRIVGYIAGHIVSYFASRDCRSLLISAFYLEPDYRGPLFYSRTMLHHMAHYGRMNGCKFMEMGPQGRVRRGIGRLLERMGWVESPEPCWRKYLNGRNDKPGATTAL